DVHRMARGRVGAVRLVANWALIEPTDDAWRFGALDGQPRGEGGIPGAKPSADIAGIKEQVEDIRKVLKQKKNKGIVVWLTELGWGSSKKGRLSVGKKEQAKLLKQSFKLLVQGQRHQAQAGLEAVARFTGGVWGR